MIKYRQLTHTSHLNLEPCPPANIQAVLECEQHSATVYWQLSNLATGYVAYLDNHSGHATSCTGTQAQTQCVVSGIVCGSAYRVWVKALGLQHNSTDSNNITLTAGITREQHVRATETI